MEIPNIHPPHKKYTWYITVSDGFVTIPFVIEEENGNASIADIRDMLTLFLHGEEVYDPRTLAPSS